MLNDFGCRAALVISGKRSATPFATVLPDLKRMQGSRCENQDSVIALLLIFHNLL